jgi:hypothetical protein
MAFTEVIEATHQGKAYSVTGSTTLSGADDSITFIGLTDSSYVHFQDMSIYAGGGDLEIKLVEMPTVSDLGMLYSSVNRKRDSTRESRMSVYLGGTVTGGTVLYSARFYGDDQGSHMTHSSGLIRGEWILDKLKTYAVTITNKTTPSAAINLSIDMLYLESDI